MDIKIDIKDDRTYAQAAYFVDSPLIAKDIRKLQRDFKILPPLLYDINSLEGHFLKLAGYNPIQYHYNFPIPTDNGFHRLFADLNNFSSYLFHNNEKIIADQKAFDAVTDLFNTFLIHISGARRPYFYPRMFDSVVLQAVLFSEVKYFKSAYATTINTPAYSFEANEDIEAERDISTAIMVMPNSTEKDIMHAFTDIRKDLRNVVESTHPLIHILDKDSVSNIRQQRYWYWQIDKGREYSELLDEWNKQPGLHDKESEHGKNNKYCPSCLIFDTNRLEKFVKRYRDILKTIS